MSAQGEENLTEYRIAPSVLEAIVRGSIQGDSRARVHASHSIPRKPSVTVLVTDVGCSVKLRLDARMGEHLPALASEVRERVASVLGTTTGLWVEAVDVTISRVFPLSQTVQP